MEGSEDADQPDGRDSAGGAPGSGDQLRELDGRRLSLVEQRRVLKDRLRDLQRQRALREAQLEERQGERAAERTRLEFELGEAQRNEEAARDDPRSTMASVELSKRAVSQARENLADHEVEAAQERTSRSREIAEMAADEKQIAAELEDLGEQLSELNRERDRTESERQADRAAELESQLQELAPIVEAQREAVGISGVKDLSRDYTDQANAHATAWKRWGCALVATIVATVVGGLILFSRDKVPSGEITGPTVVDLVRNLFVIGLLLYGVRITSLQFRVHRHLEAVARNKSAALSTFNRIVSVSSEKEIRNSLAIVLAQSVFSSDETGFVDAAQDHVTLIERLAASPQIGVGP